MIELPGLPAEDPNWAWVLIVATALALGLLSCLAALATNVIRLAKMRAPAAEGDEPNLARARGALSQVDMNTSRQFQLSSRPQQAEDLAPGDLDWIELEERLRLRHPQEFRTRQYE